MVRTLVDDILAAADRSPAAPAVSWHSAVWSYAELVSAIRHVATGLAERGVRPGDRVGLLIRNSPQFAAAYYGVMVAGAVAVPLNVQERAGVLERQVRHVDCRAVIGDVGHVEWGVLSTTLDENSVVGVPVSVVDEPDGCSLFCSTMATSVSERHAAAPAELAMILHTSGTTAHPKAVMLTHGNLQSNAEAIAEYLRITAEDRVLTVLPFHFSYGASVLNSHLIRGAHVLLEDNLAFPHLLLKRIGHERVTGFPGVPSTFGLLLSRCNLAEFDLSSLRYVTQAGGPMPSAYLNRLRSELPATQVFVMYGQSEATARLTYLPPEKLDEKPGSVGIPLPGVEIEIRSELGRTPPGENGEIWARGPNIMAGYWGEPELTAGVLQEGWLRTGDRGRLDDDGYLYIEGRSSEMIKVGAYRVSPQEVEEVLAEFPGVAEAGVVGVPDSVLGEAVKAVLVMREDVEASLLAIKAHCRARLASYKVPKIIEFSSALPRTSSGKVKRTLLA